MLHACRALKPGPEALGVSQVAEAVPHTLMFRTRNVGMDLGSHNVTLSYFEHLKRLWWVRWLGRYCLWGVFCCGWEGEVQGGSRGGGRWNRQASAEFQYSLGVKILASSPHTHCPHVPVQALQVLFPH